ncbi:MAG: SinI family restriction endonuclease [Cytophagales bacterium]|jgi:hypothetical protein|nr:SinI family restriction endonuclease [Cytophagales bacterium]
MKPTTAFDEYSIETAVNYGREILGAKWDKPIETVLGVALSDKRNLPALGFKESQVINFQAYIGKWVRCYRNGYESRPSAKTGKPGGTVPDGIVEYILRAKLPNLDDQTAVQIVAGHTLLMSIESLVGQLLEEYLAVQLAADGWCCCWGSTIDAVDFCRADGSLLQVKTSDNTENSSSSRVRNGTTIEKWARRNSKRANIYYWEELNHKVGRNDLSEEGFRQFVKTVLDSNPACFYITAGHPLTK